MAATQLLHVLEEASRYSHDHNSLIQRVASVLHLQHLISGCSMMLRRLKHLGI